MSTYEQRLRALLAEVYNPDGVEIFLRSRLRIGGGNHRTWEQYVEDGDGQLVLDWAERLVDGSF